MNTFTLKIVACDRVFYEGECEVLVFQAEDGEMAIMANHEAMTTCLEVGELRFRRPGQSEYEHAIISDGLLKVDHNVVNILVFSAERPEEIDRFRAKEAAERAREQLQQKQSIREYNVSVASLARAMARIRGVDKYMEK